MNDSNPFLKEFYQQLLLKEVEPPPPPWESIDARVIHGLLAVGYAEDSDLLLIHSAFGTGVIDCITGDIEIWEEDIYSIKLDEIHLYIEGIGPLDGKRIKIASSLWGGGLTTLTADGWQLKLFSSWPDDLLFLMPKAYVGLFPIETATKITPYGLLAYGFSQTGKSFIVAESSQLTIYSRSQVGSPLHSLSLGRDHQDLK